MSTKQGWVIGDTAFIPDDGGSSGGGLPEVTSADNGKVLTVVDGDWDVADAGGIVIVTSHYEGEEEEYTVLDSTWSELKSAMDSGNLVILKSAWNDTVSFGVLLRCNDDHSAADVQYAATFLTVFAEPVVTKFLATTKDGYPMMLDD